MSQSTELYLPESHLNILRIVGVMAWADGKLSEEEVDLLIDQFKIDLPTDPHPLFYAEDSTALFGSFRESPPISEQLQERIDAELAFKDILSQCRYEPTPLPELVAKLETQEDRCLTVKLAYMVIKASPAPKKQDNLFSKEEKEAYRQLLELVNLEPDLITEIELQADRELEQFQHPFTAFLANLKHFFHLD
jgi:hypothetical protein